MSGEIVVSETPNWLKGLEEKREQRLKVRLGHEAGAGAPCLKCGDKCPGLDLHFWRKACKICRCPKEEHDVPDDDVYGWAQFQLLGSKPNKIKTKIVLPGKKDEVELEWAPKGQKETIEKYLKTLPPEALPVKGSQAAQERKQMLQKQIPIHDIDPSLCHELNEEEVKKMEEYIAHIKKSSVGVGQIVNLSSVIKANLHNISPQEAHIIASRYSKGIPFSEIIKLQSGLAKNLEKLTVNDPRNLKNKSALPNMQPNKLGGNITEEDMQNPLVASKFKDITHPWYTGSSPNKGPGQPQYAQGYKPGQSGGLHSTHPDLRHPDYCIDQKLLEGTNFDPSKTPSQFRGYNTPGYRPVHGGPHSQGQYPNAEGVPYDKVSSRPQGNKVSYSSDIEQSKALKSGGLGGQKEGLPYDKVSGSFKPGESEAFEGGQSTGPNYAQNLLRDRNLPHSEQYGFENPYFSQNISGKDPRYSHGAAGTPLNTKAKVPGYSPSKYDPEIDVQDPKAPKSMKDLIYSAYDPSKGPLPEDNDETTEKSKNIDPAAAGYDPNVTFNTYKHDPSVIRYENHPLLGKNDPAQPLGGNKSKFGPGILKNTGQGYFDPKTGNYVSGQGQFGPGHPNYDPENPQNPSGPGRIDPKTGKYVGEDYKPRHAGQGSFGPGHLNYDPKNPQNSSGPGRIDPKTGKYVDEDYKPRHAGQGSFGPGHPNYDSKIPYGSGYFDPDTGKFIPASGNKARDGNYDPRNSGAANYDPEYLNNDPNPYGSGYFDPKTGKYILSDANNPEGGYYDPRNPGPGNLGAGDPNYDPYNPYRPGYFDPTTGKFIDGDDNNPEQERFDPAHPNYVPQNTYGPGYVDPKTGQYIRGDDNDDLDPAAPYDPTSPTAPHGPGIFDPKTGDYIPGAGGFDPQTGKYLPGQENPSYPPPYSRYPSDRPQNIPGLEDINPTNLDAGSYRKLLSQLQPGQMNISEDYLEPHMVNIGAIQDINPDIKAATAEVNPGFDNESVYSDNGAEYSPDSIREILNNVKLPDCHYCKKPFEENEYAVTVDRANVLFHAHCFRCAGCNQSLADNIYFYHKETDNVYCGRDYAKIKGYPRCTACDELIFTKEYCLAENSTFHLKHFCCFQCDTPLAGQDYTLEDEKPYCLPCYETSKAAKCSTCEKVIKPDERGCQLNGVHFHADDACFRCIVCSQLLMGKKLLLRNEKLYCSHDCFNSVKK